MKIQKENHGEAPAPSGQGGSSLVSARLAASRRSIFICPAALSIIINLFVNVRGRRAGASRRGRVR